MHNVCTERAQAVHRFAVLRHSKLKRCGSSRGIKSLVQSAVGMGATGHVPSGQDIAHHPTEARPEARSGTATGWQQKQRQGTA